MSSFTPILYKRDRRQRAGDERSRLAVQHVDVLGKRIAGRDRDRVPEVVVVVALVVVAHARVFADHRGGFVDVVRIDLGRDRARTSSRGRACRRWRRAGARHPTPSPWLPAREWSARRRRGARRARRTGGRRAGSPTGRRSAARGRGRPTRCRQLPSLEPAPRFADPTMLARRVPPRRLSRRPSGTLSPRWRRA